MTRKVAPIVLAALAGSVCAQEVNFEVLSRMFPLDMSADGSVIVGNDNNFETVRWTADTGVVNLGRGTFPLGVGAGSPDCSDDGTKVSATIITANGQFATQGLWTEGVGWVDLMPPTPSDGGVIDQSLGSAWGISGDGNSVVGLYWRPGNFDTGGAHASIASAPGAVMDLGSGGGNSRANHANFDGSVVVGWDERFDGLWQPAVWENGVRSIIQPYEGFTAANVVNPAGDIIGGYGYDDIFGYFPATLWHRDGAGGWTEQVLGVLPGTVGPSGLATPNAMTPDGSIVVGFNRFNLSAAATGFIWTVDDGMVDIKDWLDDLGVVVPSNMLIVDATCISNDGRTVAGVGVDINTGLALGFRVSPFCRVDFNNDTLVNFFDISEFITAFQTPQVSADFNNDGQLNAFDIFDFIGAFNTGCP